VEIVVEAERDKNSHQETPNRSIHKWNSDVGGNSVPHVGLVFFK